MRKPYPRYSRRNHWRARCSESGHGGFGGGSPEKGPQVGYLVGDLPCPGKQRSCPGVRARGAAGPAEYGESWIARSPISSRCKPPSTGKTPEPVPCPATVFRIRRRNLRGTGRCPVRVFKEMSGPPTFRSTRTTRTNAGSDTTNPGGMRHAERRNGAGCPA